MKNITVLGAGESGFGAAMLAKQKGFNVFVSELDSISEDIKSILVENLIQFEENNHSFDKIALSDLIIKRSKIFIAGLLSSSQLADDWTCTHARMAQETSHNV